MDRNVPDNNCNLLLFVAHPNIHEHDPMIICQTPSPLLVIEYDHFATPSADLKIFEQPLTKKIRFSSKECALWESEYPLWRMQYCHS